MNTHFILIAIIVTNVSYASKLAQTLFNVFRREARNVKFYRKGNKVNENCYSDKHSEAECPLFQTLRRKGPQSRSTTCHLNPLFSEKLFVAVHFPPGAGLEVSGRIRYWDDLCQFAFGSLNLGPVVLRWKLSKTAATRRQDSVAYDQRLIRCQSTEDAWLLGHPLLPKG